MATSEKNCLARDIAGTIEKWLAGQTCVRLPTVTRLAEVHHVSRTTIIAALKILKERGVLAPGRGRRAVVADRVSPPQHDVTNGLDRVVERLREKITSGDLRSGDRLPKLSIYVKEYRVSTTTVIRAVAQLRASGIVHKEGRAWVVGREPSRGLSAVRVWEQPIIGVLVPTETKWRSLLAGGRTAPFCRTFDEQASIHGVQLRFGLIDSAATNKAALPAGMALIERMIREAGSRYRGTLVVGVRGNGVLDDTGITLSGIVEQLRKYKRPTVWFDPYDDPRGTQSLRKPFYRAHFCEIAGIQAALEHLVSAGHTTLGCPVFDEDNWQLARRELISKCASRMPAGISLITPPAHISGLNGTDNNELAGHMRRLHSTGIIPLRNWIGDTVRQFEGQADPYASLATMLKEHAPMGAWRFLTEADPMAACLRMPSVSVLVAPNDLNAGHMWEWLARAGVKVPQAVSLLSFDNFDSIYPRPLDSVDFGFGYLGYCAFHAIHEVVPIRACRNGDIPARAHVVVRGSVGRPPKHRDWRRFLGETV